jgi:hypothetical protein
MVECHLAICNEKPAANSQTMPSLLFQLIHIPSFINKINTNKSVLNISFQIFQILTSKAETKLVTCCFLWQVSLSRSIRLSANKIYILIILCCWVQFQIISLDVLADLILSAALWPWGWLSLYHKWEPGIFLGKNGGQWVRLITVAQSVSQLSRQCAHLSNSQPHKPPRNVTWIDLSFYLRVSYT